MRDEELTPTRVSPVECDTHRPPQIRALTRLVAHRVAGTAFPVSARIAALNDEVGDDAMEGEILVEALLYQRNEVVDHQRRVEHCQLELNRPSIGIDERLR